MNQPTGVVLKKERQNNNNNIETCPIYYEYGNALLRYYTRKQLQIHNENEKLVVEDNTNKQSPDISSSSLNEIVLQSQDLKRKLLVMLQ